MTPRTRFEKSKRGSVQWISDEANLLVRWNDNKAVTVGTNFKPLDPLITAKRYVKKEGGHIKVDMPGPVATYNKHMGDVDLFDQCVANYRCTMRTKKWWWPLFRWGVDAARTNAWLLSQRATKGAQFPFIRLIAKSLVKRKTIPKAPGGYQGQRMTCVDIRYDGLHHWPEELETRFHRSKQCGSRTNIACSKCEVALHPKCFKLYHVRDGY